MKSCVFRWTTSTFFSSIFFLILECPLTLQLVICLTNSVNWSMIINSMSFDPSTAQTTKSNFTVNQILRYMNEESSIPLAAIFHILSIIHNLICNHYHLVVKIRNWFVSFTRKDSNPPWRICRHTFFTLSTPSKEFFKISQACLGVNALDNLKHDVLKNLIGNGKCLLILLLYLQQSLTLIWRQSILSFLFGITFIYNLPSILIPQQGLIWPHQLP